jgi:hypothetical protein
VRQLNMLNRLAPEVAAMLEPPDQKLTTQVGVTLANLRPDVQVRLALEIASRGLRHRAALSLVRGSVTNDQRVSKQGRRRPSDDFAILAGFLRDVGPRAQSILDLGPERIAAMFAHRDPKARATVRAVVAKRAEQLRELGEALR